MPPPSTAMRMVKGYNFSRGWEGYIDHVGLKAGGGQASDQARLAAHVFSSSALSSASAAAHAPHLVVTPPHLPPQPLTALKPAPSSDSDLL